MIRRFISQDTPSVVGDLAKVPGQLNLYAYCNNNPVKYTDSSGTWFLIDDLIAAAAGLIAGVVGQLVSDLVTSLFTGQWHFSSWEMYVGAAAGGAAGGLATLYLGPIAGGAIGMGLSTFIGQGLENLTGTSNRTWGEIILNTAFSAGIGALTGGLTKNMKIPGITKGSHSFQQVYKSGITKALKSGYNMALKTAMKGLVYQTVTNLSVGWLLGNSINGFNSAVGYY